MRRDENKVFLVEQLSQMEAAVNQFEGRLDSCVPNARELQLWRELERLRGKVQRWKQLVEVLIMQEVGE